MQAITTIDLDIAKSVFQVHGVDAAGNVVIRRQLKRRYVLAFFQKLPPCLIGIEACASTIYRALVRYWRLLWLPALLIRRRSDQEETSRPGSGSSPSRPRAGIRTGSAVSANESIAL